MAGKKYHYINPLDKEKTEMPREEEEKPKSGLSSIMDYVKEAIHGPADKPYDQYKRQFRETQERYKPKPETKGPVPDMEGEWRPKPMSDERVIPETVKEEEEENRRKRLLSRMQMPK